MAVYKFLVINFVNTTDKIGTVCTVDAGTGTFSNVLWKSGAFGTRQRHSEF